MGEKKLRGCHEVGGIFIFHSSIHTKFIMLLSGPLSHLLT